MNFNLQKIKEKTLGFVTREIKTNKIRFFAILAFILTATIIAVIISCYRCRMTENASSEKLSSALDAFAQGDQQRGFNLLGETIKNYPKSPTAYRARLIKADILTEIGQYDEALAILTETANKGKPCLIKPLASVRIIHVYDSKRDFFNAIAAAKDFISKYPNHFLTKDMYLNLAEYFLLYGSKDEAVKVLNDVLVNFPATPESQKAQDRLIQLAVPPM
jgi:tetratricopeptide (TPR) repeat protein